MTVDVLAFGPHPDDIELTCAGTLLRLASEGYATGVVSLTAGELGTRGTVETRAREFDAAAAVLGTRVHRILNLPDGGLSSCESQKREVIETIRELRPRIVLAPYWEDRHPDHANGSKLVSEASFLAGLSRIETGQPAHRPVRVLFYPCRYEFKPSFIVDVSDFHERKVQAIHCYQSQFGGDSADGAGQVETNISHPGFLEAVIARARQYGSYIGVAYGEPFLVREPMKLNDPVAFFGQGYSNSFV
ncbi:MAG: bacillithiol biosynthesis deacetylase BshB1 [Acidobacteriota bacterium]|nr:MAG: bacillithiol biosynthesis deacetylase BshB1 [Acidobacteriota bacterium]